jgi:thiol-disulfide isomerase/thioredoxin
LTTAGQAQRAGLAVPAALVTVGLASIAFALPALTRPTARSGPPVAKAAVRSSADARALLSLGASSGRLVVQFVASGCADCAQAASAVSQIEAPDTPVVTVDSGDVSVPAGGHRGVRADDRSGRLAASFGVTQLPTTFVFGPDGQLSSRLEGRLQPVAGGLRPER